MGGLRKCMPITAVTFIVGWLAIAGVPPFAGFWSKDEILLFAWNKQHGALGCRPGHRAAHRLLHEPPGLPRLLRRGAVADSRKAERPTRRRRRRTPARAPRVAVDDDRCPLVVLAGLSLRRRRLEPAVRRPTCKFLEHWLEPVVEAARRTSTSPPATQVVAGRASRCAVGARRHRAARAASTCADAARSRSSPSCSRTAGTTTRPITRVRRRARSRAAFEAVADVRCRKVVDGAVNGVGALVPRRRAAVLRRVQTGFVRTTPLGIAAGAVVLARRASSARMDVLMLLATEGARGRRFPLLTALVVLPAIGALVVALMPADAGPSCTGVVGVLFCAAAVGASAVYAARRVRDRRRRASSSRSTAQWIASFGISWHLGVDGISLFLVVLTGVLFPLALARASTPHHDPKPYYAWLLAARGRLHRRVPRARPVPVLRVLRDRARADVLPHRRVGLRRPRLRGAEVLPVHDVRLGVHARRHPGPGVPARSGHRRRALTFDLVEIAEDHADDDRRPTTGPLALPRASPSPSRSRCRCSRCTPGCPTPTPRRRPRAR